MVSCRRWVVELLPRIAGRSRDEDTHPGPGRRRKDHDSVQAAGGRGGHHDTDHRLQRRASSVQELKVSGVGPRGTDQHQVRVRK